MTDAEKEILGLLKDLVRETKRMAGLVAEMSVHAERTVNRFNVHVNGEVPTPPIAWPHAIAKI
jgi:hypothetical protein